MSDIAIHVDGIGKSYRIAHAAQRTYRTLQEDVLALVKRPFERIANGRTPRHETFWALQDISFDVKQGEVLGIIGRNGAGKSTLLKILSRITKPTTGYADVYGRVGSLLEVGTGFHPELTGRENIFLNGAILGMTRREIQRRFDEIVAFSEVEQFLDTPTKRYSSGMYMRLAFAVAAHLDPEVLIVDEVLAVGDSKFQEKCLGKMNEVASGGRTVLFVSHNMGAIQNLCTTVMYLKRGQISFIGPTEKSISQYREDNAETGSSSLATRQDRRGNGNIRFTDLRVFSPSSRSTQTGAPLVFELDYEMCRPVSRPITVAMSIDDVSHIRLFTLWSRFLGDVFRDIPERGTFVCEVPQLPLKSGQYFLHPYMDAGGEVIDDIEVAGVMNVDYGDFYPSGLEPSPTQGSLVLKYDWKVK